MSLSIVCGDIAKVRADAIVNAANPRLAPGGGVCGAIFSGAGFERMREACREIGGCPVGGAVVTPAFNLPARFVIHAVGPVWRGGDHGEREALRSAYRSAFERAEELAVSSITLPLISTGAHGYPVSGSMELARGEARRFLDAHPDASVLLAVLDRHAFVAGIARFRAVAAYVASWESLDDGLYGAAPEGSFECASLQEPVSSEVVRSSTMAAPIHADSIDEAELFYLLQHLDDSFSQMVLALIDRKGMTDAEVYKRANISRQLFSKLRKDDHYQPSKPTAVALAFALYLTPEETDDLLERAGYTLSHASKFDLIVTYFLEHGCHDVLQLNEVLFAFDQPLVGSV